MVTQGHGLLQKPKSIFRRLGSSSLCGWKEYDKPFFCLRVHGCERKLFSLNWLEQATKPGEKHTGYRSPYHCLQRLRDTKKWASTSDLATPTLLCTLEVLGTNILSIPRIVKILVLSLGSSFLKSSDKWTIAPYQIYKELDN